MKCKLLMSSRNHLLYSPFSANSVHFSLGWLASLCFPFRFMGEKKKVLDRQAWLRECGCRNFQKMEVNDSWSGTGLLPTKGHFHELQFLIAGKPYFKIFFSAQLQFCQQNEFCGIFAIRVNGSWEKNRKSSKGFSKKWEETSRPLRKVSKRFLP